MPHQYTQTSTLNSALSENPTFKTLNNFNALWPSKGASDFVAYFILFTDSKHLANSGAGHSKSACGLHAWHFAATSGSWERFLLE